MQKTRFTEEIKHLTAPAHQALEKSIIKIIRTIVSLADYEKMLVMFYGYYKPLEDLIHQHLHHPTFSPETRQSEWLLSDIRQLGNNSPEFSCCTELPQLQHHIHSIAALYVLEGSALGGVYILKMIRKHIHLSEGFADRFFNSHGIDTTAKWNHFRELLDANVTMVDRATFLEAATDTFSQFKNWAELNYTYEQQEKL